MFVCLNQFGPVISNGLDCVSAEYECVLCVHIDQDLPHVSVDDAESYDWRFVRWMLKEKVNSLSRSTVATGCL